MEHRHGHRPIVDHPAPQTPHAGTAPSCGRRQDPATIGEGRDALAGVTHT
jgi:hypothetical protein